MHPSAAADGLASKSGHDEQNVAMYRIMAVIRELELRVRSHIERHGFGGFWHSGLGQEATQVGAVSALRSDDYLFYAHRGLGYAVAKGMDLHEIVGDIFARQVGSTGGKGAGTAHFVDPDRGVLGQGGTLGSCFPLAAGAAVSSQLLGQDRVCAAFFGDGAASRGTFHEAALQASAWRLPVVWICENNGWAISTPFAEQSPTRDIADRAVAYGMPGVVVDGQDALAVRDAVREAVDRARQGGGPSLIEAKTVRVRGHYEGDVQKYRTDLEDEAYARDPLRLLRDRLDPEVAEQAEADARRTVEQVFDDVLALPRAPVEVAYRDVWAHR